MAKSHRLLGVVMAAGLSVPFLGVGPALAEDTTTLAPSTGAYFYAEGVRKPDQSPYSPPNLTGDKLDGVAAGNLAVAAKGGTEDKVSFLLFDLLDVVPGSVVSKATLTLPLVPNDASNNSYAQDPVKVRACAAGDEGFNGDDGTAIQDAPSRKCDIFSSIAKASADTKSYVIDVTKLAQMWVDTNNDGLALTASPGALTTPFQVVFAAAAKAQLAVSYTAPATDVLPPVAPPVNGGVSTTPDLSSGFTGGVAPAPSVGSGFGSVAAPVVPVAPAPAPGVAPAAPVVAAPAAALGPIVLSTSQRPTGQFWLAGLLLLGALGLLSLILGDTEVPLASSRPSRLVRALSDRQRTAPGARPALGRAAAI